MAGTVFPAIIRPTYDPSQGFPKLVEDARSAGDQMRRQFQKDFDDIGRIARQALSVPRNQAGSLDLGVEQYKEAARNAQAHATALREVANAAANAARQTGDTSRATSLYVKAASAAALEAEKQARDMTALAVTHERLQAELNKTKSATDAVIQSTGIGTTANHMMVNSQRAARNASIQLGQQMQDVAISLYSGQRASVVFAQQLPQMAFALSGAAGKVGQVATMLSGPWSIALVAGAAALGYLIEKMGLFGSEADKATPKTYDFSKSLSVLKLDATEAANAMKQLADETRNAVLEQGTFYQQQGKNTTQALVELPAKIAADKSMIAALESQRSRLGAVSASNPVAAVSQLPELARIQFQLDKYNKSLADHTKALEDARRASDNLAIGTAQRSVADRWDADGAAARRYDEAVGKLNSRLQESLTLDRQLAGAEPHYAAATRLRNPNYITQDEYNRQYNALQAEKAAREAAKRASRSTGASASASSNLGGMSASQASNLGSMVALVKQLFPGAVITATDTKGSYGARYKHSATVRGSGRTSDHALGRGIDFVPAGGMGRYTTAQVEKMLEDAGVHIRYGAGGTKQMFGPGRSASRRGDHDDHFHFAWDGKASPEQAAEATQRALDRQMEVYARINESIAKQAEGVRDIGLQQDRNRQLQEAQLHGGQAEVEALQLKFTIMDRLGIEQESQLSTALELAGITDDEYQQLFRNLQIDRLRTRELEKQQEAQNRQLQLLSQTKDNITGMFYDLFKGGGFGAIGNAFSRQWDAVLQNMAESLTESLFGDFFRDEKDRVLGFDKVNEASTTTAQLIGALGTAADSAASALKSINGPGSAANDNSPIPVDITNTKELSSDIVVIGKPIGQAVGLKVNDALGAGLKTLLGQKLYSQFGTLVQGAAYGSVGGGLIGKNNFGANIGGIVGQSFAGNIFGKGLSKALGAFAGPLGGILGGMVGGLLGGIFGKAKTGSASVSNGNVTLGGNNADAKSSVSGISGQINSDLTKIAEALGGSLGNYAFTIGQRNDEFRVSANSGADVTSKNPGGLLYKGKDAQEAMRVALVNAIQDGAVKGIRQGAQKLLQAGKDLETQIAKALKFNNVFDELDALKDPLGHAVRKLNKEFEELISIFTEASATTEEWGQLQELYDLKRTDLIKQQTEAIKQANEQLVASLKDLQAQLRIGDSGLSLRDRLANARAIYDPLAAAIGRGETVDYDKFAQAAKDVIDITRQIYGSQIEYFNTFNEVLGLTDKALAAETSKAKSLDTSGLPGAPSFQTAANDNSSLISALDKLGLRLVGDLGVKLDAVNTNLGILIQQGLASGAIVPAYDTPVNYF